MSDYAQIHPQGFQIFSGGLQRPPPPPGPPPGLNSLRSYFASLVYVIRFATNLTPPPPLPNPGSAPVMYVGGDVWWGCCMVGVMYGGDDVCRGVMYSGVDGAWW